MGGVMKKIEIRDIPPSASREGCWHYVASGLLNYWLGPGLFEVNDAGDLRLLDFDNIQAAIGIHICYVPRPLGPRELRFLRGEFGISQTQMGVMLGYKDKQRVAAAEKLDNSQKPLMISADLLLRLHYLNMVGRHDLVGTDYQRQALDLAQHLRQPVQAVENMDHLLAA